MVPGAIKASDWLNFLMIFSDTTRRMELKIVMNDHCKLLASTNDNNISKRGDNSSHNDHGCLLPGGPVDSSPELLKQMKPIKSPNYVKRQSTSYGDIVKRFSFPFSQPLERSLSEDIPVIVRRRGCTLRVRIASITEGDLERLREVC